MVNIVSILQDNFIQHKSLASEEWWRHRIYITSLLLQKILLKTI